MPSRRCQLRAPAPFDLSLALRGHGWVWLPPHRYGDGDDGEPFRTVLRLGGQAVDATVAQSGASLSLRLDAARPLAADDLAAAKAQLRHMLRLDDDLTGFWQVCRQQPQLRWVARRGGGRLLRSAKLFEDLLKLLFTTNTTWAGTTAMVKKTVALLGPAAPSGERAFPTPAECLRPEAFWRDEVRTGYRARAAVELAEGFASGAIDEARFLEPGLPTAELRRRLLALRGFGPYAVGQAMRLCGHYEELALDSWCRARLMQLQGSRRPPSDRAIMKRYAPLAPFQGLAMWCELTAAWHGEGA